jgi:virulence factor Mce-like protein
MRQRQGPSVFGSPVLIGAITVLVLVVAVFLSYNANKGLPFVPTYDLKAEVANAGSLVVGNDVRIGGDRVGAVSKISAVRRDNGQAVAILDLKLDKTAEPLSKDSTLIVRPRSALGLKYVEIQRGRGGEAFAPGDTIPASQSKPKVVEIDEVLNIFNAQTRTGIRRNLTGFGDGLAGRGGSLNDAITALRPLLTYLDPVARNLSDPETRLRRLFQALGRAAAEVAPVAEEQAALFRNLETTFAALASVRPELQQFIADSPETLDVAIREFPRQRPFLKNSAAFFHELRPGVAVLPTTLPDLAEAAEIGTRTLRLTPPLNARLEDVFRALDRFVADTNVPRGIRRLRALNQDLRPTLDYVTPAQTVCNYATLWFRNISSLLSEGDGKGTWQRFIQVSPPPEPNNEGGPASAPANGPTAFLHSNPFPNAAAPGQEQECEAGNEDWYPNKKVIGNVPGNQGTKTDGQVGG